MTEGGMADLLRKAVPTRLVILFVYRHVTGWQKYQRTRRVSRIRISTTDKKEKRAHSASLNNFVASYNVISAGVANTED
jgi:hypothetical protein